MPEGCLLQDKMDNKADVKAIMARFNTNNSPGEGLPGSRPKVAVHPTFSGGSSLQAKKATLESNLSGNMSSNTAPKPAFLKNTGPVKTEEKNDKDLPFPKLKPTGSKFGGVNNAQEESKPPFPRQQFKPKPPETSKDSEPKSPFPKPPLNKPTLSSNLQDKEPKPAFPKPAAVSKPPWVTENSKSEEKSPGPSAGVKMPHPPKPKSSFKVLKTQVEETNKTESVGKPFSGVVLKQSGGRNFPSPLVKENSEPKDNNDKAEDTAKSNTKPMSALIARLNQESSEEIKPPPQKPHFGAPKQNIPNKPLIDKFQKENEDPSAPKRNPLPNKFALGTPPAKPNRPPNVNLEQFKKDAESKNNGPSLGPKKAGPPPPPPPSAHPSTQPPPPLASHPSASGPPLPSLPPRHPGAIIQPDPDENYDDVGVLNNAEGFSGQNQWTEEDGSDEEMYEDLEERWSSKESKEQEKKREKEEKKRLEQEKKEQKEREKKEQDLKKRFKLTGPLQVIHKVKARVDCKGGKNDLCMKQGEAIDIIRITDNPEGKWLGRNVDGSLGYVKTESVEIDYDILKRQQRSGTLLGIERRVEEDPEVYDDVASQDDLNSGTRGGVILPPPPEEDEIYHDLDDAELNVSSALQEDSKVNTWSRGLLRMITGRDDRKKILPDSNGEIVHLVPPPAKFSEDKSAPVADDEIYDDVESQSFPPPPPASSLPKLKPVKEKPEEKDPKKQKKFEKEEKEFRKKFKYDGEIQVLYKITIVTPLANKKWGNKDLPLKPGEVLDVIQKAVGNKLICRNEDGKFGFVSTTNIIAEDADIYDDIGEDCIYDND
ncbi:FYN-binding protein 1 isoform X2 [Amia ocellicauda]|uniref:FYN-binding protein 1 isoform X2 n=1 Tax=Amia ocellicauda TaxID=2972642 RepID=UPI0034642E05